ncbi:MAG: DNA mismatch repair protein MutL, partial [Solobacterium sp.]|nr:DNA mismatch repair protein MutL [Solobacterium sp.]
YPLVVLNVSMDPHLLDVNVHPSKWEVRISKENQLAELITQTLYSALHQTVSAPETKLQETPHYTKQRFDEDLPVVRPFI